MNQYTIDKLQGRIADKLWANHCRFLQGSKGCPQREDDAWRTLNAYNVFMNLWTTGVAL